MNLYSVLEKEDIQIIPLEEEMKRSYLDYAMSVIVSRALPDARDGLKTVHRRILYVMKERGYVFSKPHKKSAFIVGEVMGKYHPHGDVAIYEAMARMAQDFSMGMTLINGQGNFGSIDGDPPASMRYTEARLEKISEEILADLDMNTVAFQPNYDGSLEEPVVLPSRFPNLLLNGSSGIAVGMATNIPSHNLGELLDACLHLIDQPDAETKELMQFVTGPDFPTGGQIVGVRGIQNAYTTGKGGVVVRGKATVETLKGDRENIVITEIPYQVNKAKMVERIGELVRDKVIEGISDIRDESNRQGIRVVCELKKDANAQVTLNLLYTHTQLQTSFNCNMLALFKGVPQLLTLQKALAHFIEFRHEVIVKRTRYFLEKARDRAHILIGFAVVLEHIDEVIKLIKASRDRKEAFEALRARTWDASGIEDYLKILHEPYSDGYRLSPIQANAILDLRLHKLTNMEQQELRDELAETIKNIADLLDILGNPERIKAIMRNEFLSIKENYATPRKTEIIPGENEEISIEDLIPSEDMVITISHEGYIKRVPLNTYRAQHRGGKGRSGMSTKEEDYIQDVLVANTHDSMLFFSSYGKVYRIPVYKLPLGAPQSKGRAMVNILSIEKGEKITSILNTGRADLENLTLFFVTSFGNVRRNKLSDFDHIPSNGKRAMALDDSEQLIAVMLCNEEDDIILNTKQGLFIRFNVNDVRIFVGRQSNGVRGIKLDKKDQVISASILSGFNVDAEERNMYLRGDELSEERKALLQQHEQFILTITENGFGKRTSSYEYRTTGRGGLGANAILLSEKNGLVVAAFPVSEKDEIILITDQGRLLRCKVEQIRIAGRRTQGVIIVRTDPDERVVGVSCVKEEEPEEDFA